MRVPDAAVAARLEPERAPDGRLVLRPIGTWSIASAPPDLGAAESEVHAGPGGAVEWDVVHLDGWDSSLVVVAGRIESLAREVGTPVDRSGLPEGVRRLLALAEAVPEREGARREEDAAPWLERVGEATIRTVGRTEGSLAFLGETTAALGRFLVGRGRFRRRDLWLLVQQAGADALPIITLVSFLFGGILAFVGAVQLEQFGAAIYVANLVGVAMAHDMGAILTAIVMAGRSGAAYAAQLGSMRVNQETDALVTLGISPVDFLVVPRVVALSTMMPFLTLYSVLVGIIGGGTIAALVLGISPTLYWDQTVGALNLTQIGGGLFKALVYGVLVALAGCRQGMQCGRSASAVGDAATAAVVNGIVAIIAAAGVFAYVFYVLGI